MLEHKTVLQRVLGAEQHWSARHGHASPGTITRRGTCCEAESSRPAAQCIIDRCDSVVPPLRCDGTDALVHNSLDICALHLKLQLRKLKGHSICLCDDWMLTACFMNEGALGLNGWQAWVGPQKHCHS
jgi:hypothetical protein